MAEDKRIRVLITKVSLDRHNRGAKVVATALRNNGMEVILLLNNLTPQEVVETALQEDVDVLGISTLCGPYQILLPRITGLLKEKGADDILVVVGGCILKEDIPGLREAGVSGVFRPGTPTSEIVSFVRSNVRAT